MGNFKSRCRETFGSRNHGDQAKMKSFIEKPFPNEIYDDWAEDLELKILRRTIEQNPELFILNNLMMCVQFFENYEEEITNIRQKLVSSRESELNGQLPPQKHALIPDVLQEKVARAIDFTYLRPTSIPSVEPLQPIRIYIVFDNIEVTEHNYASPYCSVSETITYSMQLKSSKHKGYALLQRLEVNPSKKKNYSSCDEAIYSDTDSLYDDRKTNRNDNPFVTCDKKSGGSGSSSLTSPASDVNDEDSIYDEREHKAYGIDNEKQIKQLNHIKRGTNMPRSRVQRTRQSSKIKGHRGDTNSSPPGSISSGYRSGNYAIDSGSESGYGLAAPYNKSIDRNFISRTSKFISEIPRQCFQIYDPVKEKRLRLNNKDRLIKGVMHSRKYDVWYMNSTKFMDYFYDIFIDQLSESMGFDPDIDDEPQGAFIYRDKFEVLKKTMIMKDDQFIIIPCIWSPWPNIADEWLERPRATWPDYDIIEKVKETGCYMIPEGYYDENCTNNLRNLEWELTFPAAERYLETCMSYSQVRIYLMALMLQKTFMRPLDSYVGLTGAHIRNQLFWLIEDNDTPSKWHDSHMGECLNMLLKSLYRAISQDIPNMPDYFIRDKNIFQNNISLLRTQKQLKRIIENPVMYLLHAMQNIKHSRSFFPKLDYTMLLKILTEDILTLINPHLAAHQSQQKFQPTTDNIQENQYDRGGFWNSAKQTKERNNIYSRKPVTNKSLIDAKTSSEQVIEITVRCAELDSRRLCLLLDLFIKHFIKIAECCNKYGALMQKKIYIDQAERLSILLSEYGSHKDDAKAYLDKLHALRKRTAKIRSQIDGPETPKRNIDRPMFSSSLNDRYKNSTESLHTFVEIMTPGETSEYALDESEVYKCKSPIVQRKHVSMAVVHEVESKLSGTEYQTNSDEITINNDSEIKQNIIAMTPQQKTLDTDDTYI